MDELNGTNGAFGSQPSFGSAVGDYGAGAQTAPSGSGYGAERDFMRKFGIGAGASGVSDFGMAQNAIDVSVSSGLSGATKSVTAFGAVANTGTNMESSSTGDQFLRKAYETALKAVKQRSRGLPLESAYGAMLNGNSASPGNDSANVTDKTVNNLNGLKTANDANSRIANAAPVTTKTQNDYGITTRRVGNRDVSSYVRGSTRVEIPSDINVNDEAKVGAYIAEQNDVIDMMDNRGNEEEVF